MSEAGVENCFKCKHYISSYGEKGYCRLFDHETTMPEKSCTRYENKPQKEIAEKADIKRKPEKKLTLFNVLLIGALVGTFVITLVGLMFGVNLIMSVITVESFPFAMKLLTVLLTAFLALLGVYLLFVFGKKFIWARILEIIFALVVVILLLIYKNYVFEYFISWIIYYMNLFFV